MQWLMLPAWKVGYRGFEPHFGLQVSKNKMFLPRSFVKIKYCKYSVTERARPQTSRARISNPVSGGQCHRIHLTIVRRFSWPSLAYNYVQKKGGLKPHSCYFVEKASGLHWYVCRSDQLFCSLHDSDCMIHLASCLAHKE